MLRRDAELADDLGQELAALGVAGLDREDRGLLDADQRAELRLREPAGFARQLDDVADLLGIHGRFIQANLLTVSIEKTIESNLFACYKGRMVRTRIETAIAL